MVLMPKEKSVFVVPIDQRFAWPVTKDFRVLTDKWLFWSHTCEDPFQFSNIMVCVDIHIGRLKLKLQSTLIVWNEHGKFLIQWKRAQSITSMLTFTQTYHLLTYCSQSPVQRPQATSVSKHISVYPIMVVTNFMFLVFTLFFLWTSLNWVCWALQLCVDVWQRTYSKLSKESVVWIILHSC